jgi:hypothetical protein
VELNSCHPTGALNFKTAENNVARVKAVLDRDRCLGVRLKAEEVGLPKTDVHQIITEDLHEILHHDNAPSHTSIAVMEFLAQN